MKRISILALALLATGASAKNYGMAGCGLGSIVMGPTGNQVLAATTNGTLGNQTIGITFGLSNCAEDGVALRSQESRSFAEANFESLKQEMAQGQGQNLVVLASLMGCDAAALGSATRTNYSTIFSSSELSSDAMLESVASVSGTACAQR